MRTGHRRIIGGLAAAAIAAVLGSLLALTAAADPPILALVASSASVGQPIHATAQLTESPGAEGTISFEVFGPSDPTCAGPPLTPAPGAATVNGEGSYESGDFTPPGAGTYSWSAHYTGDFVNPPADASCAALSTVSKATPTLTGSAANTIVGGTIHDEVSLSGGFSPSGEVTFSVYAPSDSTCATPLETSTVPIQSAHATSANFTTPQVGSFRWTASYPGDANNEAFDLVCNQISVVAKASPTLSGVATSFVEVGQSITDSVTLAAGFSPEANLVFRAYGPNDPTCATTPKYVATVSVSGNGPYIPLGFAPARGLYRWTVTYGGDANNEAFSLGCNAINQSSIVGMIDVTLTASAGGATVGNPVTTTATIKEGVTPTGQIIFKAFPASDANCSGAAIFSSIVSVAGNGSYRSAPLLPTRVENIRWTVAYSGDAHHNPAALGCGTAVSSITQARPSIAGAVKQQLTVGTPLSDTAILQGGYVPGGTVTFRIYGPVAAGCAKPLLVDIVAVRDNGTVSSDPFTPTRPGRYSFVASYSGDAANQAATEACDSPSQVTHIRKYTPRVKPRALLIGRRTISIRARLSGGASPSGAISFRLYRPGDSHCTHRPAFTGAISVKSNGNYSLAQYLATKRGVYRLSVSYSGDQRNQQYKGRCGSAQPIRVG